MSVEFIKNFPVFDLDGQRITFSNEVFAKHKSKCFSPAKKTIKKLIVDTETEGHYEDKIIDVYIHKTTKVRQADYPGYRYKEICVGCGHSVLSN